MLPVVEERLAALRSPENEVLRYGPTGKVPALLTDDGRLLMESLVICWYLDGLHEGPRLIPTDEPGGSALLEIETMATVLMDSLSWRARELWRPNDEQSASFLVYEAARCERCYDALVDALPDLAGPVTSAQITVAVALSTADEFHGGDDWRKSRSELADWHGRFAARPSMIETKPPTA
jgi:glutathione S-transferase